MSKEITRRQFIIGAAAAGVVLGTGGMFVWKGHNIPAPVRRGDVTYDVLIIGSGGAAADALSFDDGAGRHEWRHGRWRECQGYDGAACL